MQLKAGCKVGGIEAARLATGLETGTGEADLFQRSSLTRLTCMEWTRELSNPMFRKNRSKSVADALVVVMNPAKAEGAKGSNGLVI